MLPEIMLLEMGKVERLSVTQYEDKAPEKSSEGSAGVLSSYFWGHCESLSNLASLAT